MATTTEEKILNAARAGNYPEVNRLTGTLTAQELSNFSAPNMERIMYELAKDIGEGLGVTSVTTATNSLRIFSAKISAVMTADAAGVALDHLAYQIDQKNSSDYRAIDAITDNMNASARESLPVFTKERVIKSIADNILDGMDAHNQSLTDSSTTALRDFMSKFGAYMSADAVDDTLIRLTNDMAFRDIVDYRSVDAITDYMTTDARAALSASAKTSIIDSLILNIANEFHTTQDTNDRATVALRDFMSKFRATLTADMFEHHIALLVGDYNSSNQDLQNGFKALDAITDYLSFQIKADISVSVKAQVIDRLSDLIVEVHNSDEYRQDLATTALNDFMVKFGTTLTLDTLVTSLGDLAKAHEASGLAVILHNVPAALLSEIKTAFNSDLAAHDVHIMSTASETGRFGNESSIVFAFSGNDTVYAGGGNDTVYGGTGNDTLYGEAGNDQLYGGSGNDMLRGGTGHDQLYGDAGSDTLYGNSGADIFIFNTLSSSDHVMDFSTAQGDKLDLSAILEGFDPLTESITDFVRATTVDNITTLSVDIDGTNRSASFVTVATLDNGAVLDIAALYNNGQLIT